jgi:serine/threonine protein kinase
MKKIQSNKLNKSNQKNLTNPVNMNKIINKITSNTESLLKDLKKKSESNQKFTDINLLNKNNNLKGNNNQKISMTTPVTKKNSRKNSLDKALLKNVIYEAENKNTKSNTLLSFNNKSSNLNKLGTKQNAKMSSGVNSNYITNNSNVSNNSGVNLTNNSLIKGGGKNIFYKEINLITEDSKKSQKVESDTIEVKNNNNQQNNNFSNIKLYDISKNNFVKTPSAYLKKKNNFGNSLPITNKSSKTGSKNNSKSVSRIDEKIIEGSTLIPNNVAINISEINQPSQKKNNPGTSSNSVKAKINIGSSLPLANNQNDKMGTTKKHLTSKNSPSHFPFNFSKDGGLKSQTKSMKKENPKEVAIQINKPIASLNLEKNKKTLTSLKASLEKDNLISTHAKPNLDKSNLIDLSMESGLNNSTSSVRSTVRESNYYKKEAEKISQFLKSHWGKYNEYPQSNLKFYKIGRLLGRGAFGKVNLGLHTASGRLVAIKSFNKSRLYSESARKKIYYETNLMKNLKHNSIVKIFEIIESPRYILIILEFVCGGDLLSFVRKRTKLNEQTAKFIFRQIVEALRYIHSQNIIHRDIKLDNILIDLNNTVKICDFGVGRQVQLGDVMHDQCGTPAYIAPEILLNEGYDGFGVDVWSSGVVLYAMLSGTVPFKANNMPDLHSLIIGGTYNTIKDISPEAISLLSGILQTDPKLRLTTEQILNHEWLRSTDEIFNGKIKSLNKLNLFANAERTVLSKSNIDYRNAHKDDLIENFTLKYLDTNQESENQNVSTKSHILAPFNSTIKHKKNLSNKFSNAFNFSNTQNLILVENDVIKFIGKAKEANRNYELNNNGEIDNGILINSQNPNPINNSQEEDINMNNNDIMREDKSPQKASNSKATSKQISKPSSPPEFKNDDFIKDDTNRNSRKNVRDNSITNTNTNTFIIGKTKFYD